MIGVNTELRNRNTITVALRGTISRHSEQMLVHIDHYKYAEALEHAEVITRCIDAWIDNSKTMVACSNEVA